MDKNEMKFNVNMKSVNYKLLLYSKITGLYIFASVLLVSMCIYVLFVLISLYKKWMGRKKRMESYVKEQINNNDSSLLNSKIINSGKKDDDEVYKGVRRVGDGVDEYYKFDDNINSIISSYKSAKKECNDKGSRTECSKDGENDANKTEPERAFIDPSYDDYK